MHWTQNLCRICGEISENYHLIFNCAKEPPHLDTEAKIKKCLKLNIFKDDYKPKQLCNACLIKLDDFHQFIDMCHETDQKFESILLNRNEWPGEIIDYTTCPQKMSVIVTPKPLMEQLVQEIDSVLPLENLNVVTPCEEMLDIESYNSLQENLDYLTPPTGYGNKNYYQESTVLRHSSNYQESSMVINYSCQNLVEKDLGQNLTYENNVMDYSNYNARPTQNFLPSCQTFIEPEAPLPLPPPPPPPLQQPKAKPAPSNKTFPCPQCEKQFKRRVTLNAHMAVHTNIRPYVCDVCSKSFASKCELTNHQKVHTDKNKCKFCTSTFSVPSKLERHLRTHTKDKPFTCDFKDCSVSFGDKRNLDSHKAVIHSDECNFKCKDCGKAFKSRNRLKQHGKTHDPAAVSFACDICSKAYRYKSTLIFHMKKHNGYLCPHCNEDCGKRVKLLKHKRVCPAKL